MSSKRKTKGGKTTVKRPSHAIKPTSGEDRRSVAVTVGWLMSAMATGASLLLYVVAQAVVGSREPGQDPSLAHLFPAAALFTTLVTSIITLLLTPFVYWFRVFPPPRAITAVCLGIAAAPWGVFLISFLL